MKTMIVSIILVNILICFIYLNLLVTIVDRILFHLGASAIIMFTITRPMSWLDQKD